MRCQKPTAFESGLFLQRGDLVGLREVAEGGHGGVFGHVAVLGDDGDLVHASFVALGDVHFLHAGQFRGERLGNVGAARGADDAGDFTLIRGGGVRGESLGGKGENGGEEKGEIFDGAGF